MVEREPPSDNIRRKSRELLTIEQRRRRFKSGGRFELYSTYPIRVPVVLASSVAK
jgi:hypothetical protein